MAKRNNRVRRLARKERKAKEVATRAKADEASPFNVPAE